MLPLILALSAPPLPPPVPPTNGAVLLRREVYEVRREGKAVRVGIDEWTDKGKR
jgi:hypothetical protein